MDETEFVDKALQYPQLHAFLQTVATQIQASETLEVPQHYSVGGVDVVLVLVTCTLYRWAKETLDHRHQQHQTQILEQQANIVASLMEKGLPAKEAQAVVTTLLKSIEQRPQDDPVLKKAMSLLP